MNFNEYQKLAQRTSSKKISAMEEVAIRNIEKLRKRYPDGFEVERSINRNE